MYRGFIVMLAMFAVGTHAHGMMTTPTPRTGSTNNDRSEPCGVNTPGASTWCFGRDIPYELVYTIAANHGGAIQFKFDTNGGDDSFVDIGTLLPVDSTGPKTESYTFTTNTQDGVLQGFWQSNEVDPYVSCADVKVADPMERLTIEIDNYVEQTFKDGIATLSGADVTLVKIDETSGSAPTTVYFYINHDADCGGSEVAVTSLETNLMDDAQVTAAGIEYVVGSFERPVEEDTSTNTDGDAAASLWSWLI